MSAEAKTLKQIFAEEIAKPLDAERATRVRGPRKCPVRIFEVTCCGECPHLDARWTDPPWTCTEGSFDVRTKDKIHRDCPLVTKQQYLKASGKVSDGAVRCTSWLGATVRLRKGKRTAIVVSVNVVIGNSRVDGGVRLDKPLGGFRYWNIDDLTMVECRGQPRK